MRVSEVHHQVQSQKYPKWQPPHSARCQIGGERPRFSDEGLPARGSAKVSAKSLHQHQKHPKMIPKASQNIPKMLPNPSKMIQNGTVWPPRGKPPKKVTQNDHFYFPKYPRWVPKGVLKSPKNIKNHSPKIDPKKHQKQLPKSFPKKQNTDPQKSLLGRLWKQKRPSDPQSPQSPKPKYSLGKT